MSTRLSAYAARLYKATTSSRAALSLVVANLVPLLGVLYLDWSIYAVLMVYWIESGVVGFWSVAKIMCANGWYQTTTMTEPFWFSPGARAVIVGLFAGVYTAFWFVHGIFIFFGLPIFTFIGEFIQRVLTCPALPDGTADYACYETQLHFPGFDLVMVVAVIFLFVSHGVSFFTNYLGRGEYERTTPIDQAKAPFWRIVVLQGTIMFGAIISILMGAPTGMVVALVFIKTIVDLSLHVEKHATSPDTA